MNNVKILDVPFNVEFIKLPYSGKIWQRKVWQINRSANRLLIVNTNLDGFSVANQE